MLDTDTNVHDKMTVYTKQNDLHLHHFCNESAGMQYKCYNRHEKNALNWPSVYKKTLRNEPA